uniref:hypothetical protein n=1 Tax=Streptomyces lunaelactis TaxID=1535768 RepID=UPI00359F4B5E
MRARAYLRTVRRSRPSSRDAYGYSKGWRFELEQADVFHVMATNRHDTVVTRWSIDHPVHELFPALPRQKWKRRSCGEGAHGRRIYDWARVEVRPWHREDRRHWVLARRAQARANCAPGRCTDRPSASRFRAANTWHHSIINALTLPAPRRLLG